MNPQLLHRELRFRTSRSSGAGGQHVNKVETRVELLFDVEGSQVLTDEQREIIKKRLSSYINKEGVLIVASQASRSQQSNKERTIEKFDELIAKAFQPRKKRKATRPPHAAKEQRLRQKKMRAEKKALRGKVER
jgi:ribosome-associated protein